MESMLFLIVVCWIYVFRKCITPVTFTRTMVVIVFCLGVWRAHRNFTRRVLPHPVSPITISGILHLLKTHTQKTEK